MISAALADELLQQYEGLGWEIKAALVHAAALATDDAGLRRVADPEMLKIGPKGYIHGWIFVGASGTGAKVSHPKHGAGVVTAHDDDHATVRFRKSGATHSFEAREDTAKGQLVARGDHAKTLTDRVTRDPKHIGGMSNSELKDTDDEFSRRATALGKDGHVSKTHQKVKDEIARRGHSGSGAYRQQAERVHAVHEARAQYIRERMPNSEEAAATQEKRARKTRKTKDVAEAINGHETVSRLARFAGMDDVADKHDAMAQQLREDAKNHTLKPKKGKKGKLPEPEKTVPAKPVEKPADADKLSAEADRTGNREDHVAASVAQHKAGDSDKAGAHRAAVRSIDSSSKHRDEGDQHAASAKRSGDADDHKAAATSYRYAAKQMDKVPGGKKTADDLRGKADEHDNIAQRIIKKTAEYAKAFLHANRMTRAASRTGTKGAHRAAARAHRAAGALSLTHAQREHHKTEAARHLTTVADIDAKTSVSSK